MDFAGIKLNPVEIGSQGNAILGIRDSGKSYTATKLAEMLFDAGIPFIAFDPIGVWRYLRVPGTGKGYPIVVAGGQDGDLPLSTHSAPLIVEAAMQNGVSVVLDLFDINLSKADWKRIVRDCVKLLLHKNKDHGLRHVFLEEAAEFAPQRVLDGDVYAEIEKLARMGGNSRLGYTLINQRAQELNKAVLELCDNLFLHRQKGKNALDSLRKWLELAGASGGDVMRTLPTLPQGECWAWMSSSDTPVHVKVPAKNSLHPDRRLMHGEAGVVAKKAVKVDKFVLSLQKTLPRLEEEAKSNDPKLLRHEIAQLQRKLAAVGKTDAPAWPDLRDEVARLRGIAGTVPAIRRALEGAHRHMEHVKTAVEALDLAIDGIEKTVEQISTSPIVAKLADDPMAGIAPVTKRALREPIQPAGGNGEVPPGCKRPLAALAGVFPAGMTETQWAMVAGYKKTGGSWNEYRRRLIRAGMVEQRGNMWFTTQLGADSAGEVELPPAPGPELARWWAPKVNVPMRVIDNLISVWPGSLTRVELADRIEMSSSGGSFNEYVRRLIRNSLATENGEGVRLADTVMAS